MQITKWDDNIFIYFKISENNLNKYCQEKFLSEKKKKGAYGDDV